MLGLVPAEGGQEAAFVGHVLAERVVDQVPARGRERHHPAPAVPCRAAARDEAAAFEAVDPLRHRSGRDHGVRGQLAGGPLEGLAGAAQRGQDAELAFAQAVSPVDEAQLLGEQRAQAVQAADDSLGGDVDVRPLAGPLGLDTGDVVEGATGAVGPVGLFRGMTSL